MSVLPYIRESLALVILVTSESLRFRNLYQLILSMIENHSTINWYINIQPIVNNWNTNSQMVIATLASITNIRANANLLRLFGIAIIFGSIMNKSRNCHDSRLVRIINNECLFIKQIKQIEGKITIVNVIKTETKNLEVGDIYLGTTNGLYLIHSGQFVYKAFNLDDEITNINVLNKNNFFCDYQKRWNLFFKY